MVIEVYRGETGACQYCEFGDSMPEPHEHHLFAQREGASTRTADELARVFCEDVADLTSYRVPGDLPEPEAWCDVTEDSERLQDEVREAADALGDAGFQDVWEDGYVIEQIVPDD